MSTLWLRLVCLLGPLSPLGLLAACAGPHGPQRVLDPRGPAAEQVATLWWVMLALAVLTTVGITGVLVVAVIQGRRRAGGADVSEVSGRALVWVGGVALPLVMVFGALVYSYRLSGDVYPPRSFDAEPLTIDVIGHRFWWEVRYPDHGVTTANEFHIPAGLPVRLRVTSTNVIHSLWIPQLQGKIDMIPGRTHEWWVRADAPGEFRGQCAEYCGVGHALMALWVTAVPPAEFERWIEDRTERTTVEPAEAVQPGEPGEPAEPGAPAGPGVPGLPGAPAGPIQPGEPGAPPAPAQPLPSDAAQQGRQVFLDAGCAHCHAAPGLPAPPHLASVAPDLRDFATRRTLAAGTLSNTPENLADWIAAPQEVKPGSLMPPTRLTAADFAALAAYLYGGR